MNKSIEIISIEQIKPPNNPKNVELDDESENIKEIGEEDIVIDESVIENVAINGSCCEANNNDDFFEELTLKELSRHAWTNSNDTQYYTRGCQWSPDGTCILTAVNSDGMHIFELPADLYGRKSMSISRPLDVLQSAVIVKESGTVYDYCWYPFMDSMIPETCCWIATRQHEPIHMWDAFTGELRCSYRGYDAVDEVEAAIALTFSLDGCKVLGGYKKSIKIFDTDMPGRDYTQINTKQACSCIALHSSHDQLITVGSWKSTIHIYDLRSPNLGSLATLAGHTGGVTHLKFSNSGEKLFSGARKDNSLIEWDMRNYTKPTRILSRNVDTNQKILFDITRNGKWLVSADTSGIVHAWDLTEDFKEYLFPLHQDCCNGISLHPAQSILATSTGQYHFLTEDEENSGSEIIKKYENSLTIWWCGKTLKE